MRLIAFHNLMAGLMGESRTADDVLTLVRYLPRSLCNTLIDKYIKCGLNKQTMRWTEMWLNCQAHRVMNPGMKFCSRPFISGVLHRLILKPILFKTSLVSWQMRHNAPSGNKFVDNTKLGGVVDTPAGGANIQRVLTGCIIVPSGILWSSAKGIVQTYTLEGINSVTHTSWGQISGKVTWQNCSSGDLVNNKLSMSQQCVGSRVPLGRVLPASRERWSFSSTGETQMEFCVQIWVPQYKRDAGASPTNSH